MCSKTNVHVLDHNDLNNYVYAGGSILPFPTKVQTNFTLNPA